MSTAVEWLNGGLAVLASLAAFGALNKMRWGQTRPCVMLSMLLIAIGAFGSFVAALRAEWGPYLDTALYAGLASFILATQKVPTWAGERWANPLASVIAGGGMAVFLFFLGMGGVRAQQPAPPVEGSPPPAQLQPDMRGGLRLSERSCTNLAEAVMFAAEARDDGVIAERYLTRVTNNMVAHGAPELAVRLVQRELRRVFTTGADAEALVLDVYTRCMTGALGASEL